MSDQHAGIKWHQTWPQDSTLPCLQRTEHSHPDPTGWECLPQNLTDFVGCVRRQGAVHDWGGCEGAAAGPARGLRAVLLCHWCFWCAPIPALLLLLLLLLPSEQSVKLVSAWAGVVCESLQPQLSCTAGTSILSALAASQSAAGQPTHPSSLESCLPLPVQTRYSKKCDLGTAST